MPVPNPHIPTIPNTPDVGMPLSFGPARPVVLFPVRLETRFFPQADGSSELRVRVYPDKVHIDAHEPRLTADELTWGQHFWEQTWRAGNDAERAKASWRQLADRFDPPRAAGLDFVLVMGIRDTPGGTTDWTPQLAEVFDAHHYTDGLSFVPPGTPSNNTPDAPAGFSSTDPGHETSYLAERTAPRLRPGDGSNADVLTTAFGLANAGQVFTNLPHAMATEQLDARHMNTVLWQATWGYFLGQMLAGSDASARPPAAHRQGF